LPGQGVSDRFGPSALFPGVPPGVIFQQTDLRGTAGAIGPP